VDRIEEEIGLLTGRSDLISDWLVSDGVSRSG